MYTMEAAVQLIVQKRMMVYKIKAVKGKPTRKQMLKWKNASRKVGGIGWSEAIKIFSRKTVLDKIKACLHPMLWQENEQEIFRKHHFHWPGMNISKIY